MKRMTIGKLAERARVGVETIRFYERRGLLPEPPRTGAGYRQYAASEADRIGRASALWHLRRRAGKVTGRPRG